MTFSGDVQVVVGSVILEFRDEVWAGDINTRCVSAPLAFFLFSESMGLCVFSA